MAGFSCGIGDWRPEKSNSGTFGLFEFKKVKQLKPDEIITA